MIYRRHGFDGRNKANHCDYWRMLWLRIQIADPPRRSGGGTGARCYSAAKSVQKATWQHATIAPPRAYKRRLGSPLRPHRAAYIPPFKRGRRQHGRSDRRRHREPLGLGGSGAEAGAEAGAAAAGCTGGDLPKLKTYTLARARTHTDTRVVERCEKRRIVGDACAE
jgi:hypothetical protein